MSRKPKAADLTPFMARLADLKPHPRNYREHPDDQIQHLAESIREHGFYRNIVLAEDDTILAGHGVVLAAKSLGLEEGPAVRLPIKSDSPQALKVVVGDNELEHLADQNDRLLSELLKEIGETDPVGLLGTGFDEAMLANLVFVTRPASEIRDFDAAAHWAGMPEYDEGEDSRPRLIIIFPNRDAREQLIKQIGLRMDPSSVKGKTVSTRWPWTDQEDRASTRFETSAA